MEMNQGSFTVDWTLRACWVPSFKGSQWAFGAKMTSYQRRCDVITSHRRSFNTTSFLRQVLAGVTSIEKKGKLKFSGLLPVENGGSESVSPYVPLQNLTSLTLKAPNKNCNRRHFNFLFLSFEENKAWFFMWILCLAEYSFESSSLIFSEKQWKNIYCCRDWRFTG